MSKPRDRAVPRRAVDTGRYEPIEAGRAPTVPEVERGESCGRREPSRPQRVQESIPIRHIGLPRMKPATTRTGLVRAPAPTCMKPVADARRRHSHLVE